MHVIAYTEVYTIVLITYTRTGQSYCINMIAMCLTVNINTRHNDYEMQVTDILLYKWTEP